MAGAASSDNERFASLDYIRGLSILGILIVNALAFAQPFAVYMDATASPVHLTHGDDIAWWAVQTFAREKFITLFSLLFGVSLYLVGETGKPNLPLIETPLFRRLMWLVIFGLVHGAMVWLGDVLLLYAVTGFVFWQWRKRNAEWLLVSGLALYVINYAVPVLFDVISPHVEPAAQAGPPDLTGLIDQVRSGFAGSMSGNFAQWRMVIVPEILFFLAHTLSLMMMGLGLFKAGFLKGESPAWLYGLAMAAAAVCLAVTGRTVWIFVSQGYRPTGFVRFYDLLTNQLPLIISLGYASALMRLYRTGVGRVLLYPLQCAGRMAFTNYLSQSLLMTGLFYGGRGPDAWGLPWYGQMNTAALIPIVICIWAGQLVVSLLWLQIFRYGPFEWVWRCLTYQRLVRILKQAPAKWG